MVGRLLILDDDEAVASSLAGHANGVGFECRITTDPFMFMQLGQAWRPSHILLDLIMPDSDGMEILVEIARQSWPCRIILMSGADRRILDAARRSATEQGLDVAGTLSKPFKAEELCALLRWPDQPEGGERRRGNPLCHLPPPAAISYAELKTAIETQQLFLVYQPKIRCSDQRLAGFEALVRWQHPTNGVIAPSGFVPFAEECGLIDAMTELVVELALQCHAQDRGAQDRGAQDRGAQNRGAQDRGAVHRHIAINLSAKSLTNRHLPERLAARCRHYGIDPRQVVLEVTETAAMADPAATVSLATRLRIKGFQLSIDDFGIGYSSMAQLARLPFSELKVDAAFVSEVRRSSESRKIVAAMVGLGHSLGMTVTAEGVGDQETLDFLCSAGCDFAQGYFIGRPGPHAALQASAAPAFA